MDAIANKGRAQRPNSKLPFGADIEKAALESHRHCQTGQDVRSNRREALGEWIDCLQDKRAVAGGKIALDATDEIWKTADGPVEQRTVCNRDGIPRSRYRCARRTEEILI